MAGRSSGIIVGMTVSVSRVALQGKLVAQGEQHSAVGGGHFLVVRPHDFSIQAPKRFLRHPRLYAAAGVDLRCDDQTGVAMDVQSMNTLNHPRTEVKPFGISGEHEGFGLSVYDWRPEIIL